MNKLSQHTLFIKEAARSLGFGQIGIAKAEFMEEESRRLETWLMLGNQGKMAYMENHFEKRVDPTKLVPGAKSVISLTYNYYTKKTQADPGAPKISKYAFGRDYHRVIKNKLKILYVRIREEIGDVEGRYFVDSAPVLERDWAKRSGVGWIGKNTLLIHPEMGSFYFLAEMILNLELEYDSPMKDFCGTCTRCIDACPTGAISPEGYLVDGSKCISYLTIELKEAIPEEFSDKMEDWAFGCDICQDVCPWNRFSKEHGEEDFGPRESIMEMSKEDWLEMSEEKYSELFRGSAVKRAGYKGLKRNVRFLIE